MKRLWAGAVLAALIAGVAQAQGGNLEDRVKAIEEKLKIDGKAPETGKPASGESAIEAYFKDGLKFRSTDGNFTAGIGVIVAFHARFYQLNDERVSSDTFVLRSGRLKLDFTLFKDWEARLWPTAINNGNFTIDDGYIGFTRWAALKVRIGQFKQPFGMEQNWADDSTDFPERFPGDRLTPGREPAIMIHGEPVEKILAYALSVSNGNGKAAADENSDKDVSLRAYVRPFAKMESDYLKGLHIGVAGTYGRQDKANGVLPYTYIEPMTNTTFASAGAAAPSFEFDEKRTRLGAELAYLAGPFALKAEYLYTRDKYTNLSLVHDHSHTNHKAYYVSVSSFLTGEQKTWGQPKVEKPLFGEKGGIGAIEIVARWSRWEFDDDIFDEGIINRANSAEEFDEYGASVQWYPVNHVRFTFSYVRVSYNAETESPVVVNGREFDHEDAFVFRAQISF